MPPPSIHLPYRALATLAVAVLMALLLSACGAGGGDGTPAPSASALQNKGSDTMVNLALAWAEAYQDEHPAVNISVTGGGSGTGLAALINGTVDIANASRAMEADERAAAEANGFDPQQFVVARDAIAIVVHRANPVSQLTMRQVSDIYSGQYANWSELGGDDRPIVLLSRETNSGTHVYFLEEVLRLGNPDDTTLFSPDTLLLPSSEGITAEVRDNPNAIGYEGLGYITDEMKVVAIARQDGQPYVMPSIETVNDDTYPISRELFMYTRDQPSGLAADYIEWILGDAAQQIVADLGFVPVKTDAALASRPY